MTAWVDVVVGPPPSESYILHILHLVSFKSITFKSSHNWFKIDILRLVRLLTAIFSPVQGLYIDIHNIKLKLCSKCVLAVRE